MSIFQKSKADEMHRLRAAGLPLAHAERLAQSRRNSGAVVVVAAGLGMALIGAIAVFSLTLASDQPLPQTAALTAAQSAPLKPMEPLVTPPAPGSMAVAETIAPAAQRSRTFEISGNDIVNSLRSLDTPTTNAAIAKATPASVPTTVSGPTTPDCVAQLDTLLSPLFVTFGVGDTTITPDNAEVLDQVSQRIQSCEDAYVIVAGHSDSSGDDAVNMALSWERADRTLDRLVALGVEPQSVEAIGFGARAPLAQGSDVEESADRRVDFRVLRKREGS